MGCMLCKSSAIEDSTEIPREPLSNKAVLDSRVSTTETSSRGEELCQFFCSSDGRTVLMGRPGQGNGSARVQGGQFERKREKMECAVVQHPRISAVPKAMEGEEQDADEWPSWLVAQAGEALNGLKLRREDSFEQLDKIGEGTYSNVYRAFDRDQNKIVALKKVRFDHLKPASVRFMAREILILRVLDHPNVMKLEGLVTSRLSSNLYFIFEYMEHDLSGLGNHTGWKFTEAQVKCYMQQLLRGLDHCHSRGVVHRDIKTPNLLIDNNGILKIADFGLAMFCNPDHIRPMTNRVVTLQYRPPELLLGATYYGTAIDLWSAGCIIAEMYAEKPIFRGTNEVQQLHSIFRLCGSPSEDYWRKSNLPHATAFKPKQPYRRCVAETFKEFPAPAIELIETLLSVDPADRGTSASALKSKLFSTMPLPCDPSSLPKYPPSKYLSTRILAEEAIRQADEGRKGKRHNPERRGHRESRAIPAPDSNAELVLPMQKRQRQTYSQCQSEKFNPHPVEAASGFPVDHPRPSQAVDSQVHQHKRASHSGQLNSSAAQKNQDDAPKISSQAAAPKLITGIPGSFKEASESLARQDQKHHVDAPHKEEGRGSNQDQNLVPSNKSSNMNQMMKDHDRPRIQEAD